MKNDLYRKRIVTTLSTKLKIKLHKYTHNQLKAADKTSTPLREVLIKVNVTPYGGNYDVLKKGIKHLTWMQTILETKLGINA